MLVFTHKYKFTVLDPAIWVSETIVDVIECNLTYNPTGTVF